MDLSSLIRNVPDFPKPGIQFKDITTLLKDGKAFRCVIDTWKERYEPMRIDAIVGMESRGFIFGATLAYSMTLPFVPVRKKHKLPAKTVSITYDLEYGTDTIEMHEDALKPRDRVLIVDDLLATGGTLAATVGLVRQLGAEVVEAAVLIELSFLEARKRLEAIPIHSLIQMGE
ncbi:MAG: adenine phosphoribosyltransferase [FCB group bacterium]|jgi:adenine phosphoribosyltransferase|nr:adenine phosphoribosyltransferase [FCB group bacterium]